MLILVLLSSELKHLTVMITGCIALIAASPCYLCCL